MSTEEEIRKDERARVLGEVREAFFDKLEAAGWSQGEEVPTDEIEHALDSALSTLTEDSDDKQENSALTPRAKKNDERRVK